MSAKTGIEWTDSTWNPIRGCTRVSEGCRNCYAERQAMRFNGPRGAYEGLVTIANGHPAWTGKIQFVEKHLLDPLSWRQPRRIFVDSMSDLFHEGVTDEMRDQIFGVMLACPRHTFQVLTKRPQRMLEYLRDTSLDTLGIYYTSIFECLEKPEPEMPTAWPLPNVWFGVSVENQKAADERIPLLLKTPAAVRFLSCEPLLGPIELAWALSRNRLDIGAGFLLRGSFAPGLETLRPLDWVICGGESGPGARPMHPDWARSLRGQCQAAGVPFFFKQWGEWCNGSEFRRDAAMVTNDGRIFYSIEDVPNDDRNRWNEFDACMMAPVGKKAAGALLDGREWKQFPEVRA